MDNNYDKVLLFSGGIDSFVAYYYLNFPQTVYFNLKSRYSDRELAVVRQLIPETIIDDSLNLGSIERGSGYLPYRNLFLAMLASAKYSDTVVIAGLKDDVVSDKTESAFAKFSNLLSELEGKRIEVISPFWQMTKVEVVKWFVEKGLGNNDLLLQTISCYDGNEPSNFCGQCQSCFRKWVALRANGFSIDFYNKELILDYKTRCENGRYDELRSKTTLAVIDAYLR